MDSIYLAFLIYRREKKRRIVKRRWLLFALREKNSPFDLDDNVFVKFYRLPKELCIELIRDLEPFDSQKSRIPFQCRFMVALYFYSHGSNQQCVTNSYTASMSQATVSRVISSISLLLVERKGGEIYFPETFEEQTAAKIGFHQRFGIKGTIGAIDCTHIPIIAPHSSDDSNPVSLYMNRKGYYSINVEATCDHRQIFTSVNAKFPGSCHDSGIWITSPARITLMQHNHPSRNTWLLGDQGYPLEPWLLTPPTQPITAQEKAYNKLHIFGRNVIERSFGVVKGRFRCLSKFRPLSYSHQRAANIIYACFILHNILIKRGVDFDEIEIMNDGRDLHNNEHVHGQDGGFFREVDRIRSAYISTLN